MQYIWEKKQGKLKDNFEIILEKYNDLHELILSLFQLGGLTVGHGRGPEISRLKVGTHDGGQPANIAIKIFGEQGAFAVHPHHNTTSCTIEYQSKKSTSKTTAQESPQEPFRCLSLLIGLARPLIARVMTDADTHVEFIGKLEDGVSCTAGDLSILFVTTFGYRVHSESEDTNEKIILKVSYETNSQDCLKYLHEYLGAKINLRSMRQLRTAVANYIGDLVTTKRDQNIDPIMFHSTQLHKTNFFALNLLGFSFNPLYTADQPRDARTKDLHTHPYFANKFNNCYDPPFKETDQSLVKEAKYRLSDAFMILPSHLSDLDILKLKSKSKNTGDSTSSHSVIVTPNLFFAEVKHEALTKQGIHSTLLHNADTPFPSVDSPSLVLLSLEYASTYDGRKNLTNFFHNRKSCEIIYTDLPLVLFDDNKWLLLQSMVNLNIYHSTKIGITTTMGKVVDRVIAESVCPQCVLSKVQRSRYESMKKREQQNQALLENNGWHECSDAYTVSEQTYHLIYKTTKSYKRDAFFKNLTTFSRTEEVGILFIFASSENEVESIGTFMRAEEEKISRNSYYVLSISDLSNNSLDKFKTSLSKCNDNGGWRVICIARAEAAYVVKYMFTLFMENAMKNKTITVAHHIYGGLATYLQCLLCQGSRISQNTFMFIHDEDNMERKESIIAQVSQQMCASNDECKYLFSNQSLANLLCHAKPTTFFLKMMFDEVCSKGNIVLPLEGLESVLQSSNLQKITEGIELEVAKMFSEDDYYTKETKTRYFVQNKYDMWAHRRSMDNKRNMAKLEDINTKLSLCRILKSGEMANADLIEGIKAMCHKCCLPQNPQHSRGKCNKLKLEGTSTLQTLLGLNQGGVNRLNKNQACIFDRRLYLPTQQNVKSLCCDSCYVYHSLLGGNKSDHHKVCGGDLLFIYIVLVFGDRGNHAYFRSSVDTEKKTNFINFETRFIKCEETVKLWQKNLIWITSSEKRNLDFWYFVEDTFGKKLLRKPK